MKYITLTLIIAICVLHFGFTQSLELPAGLKVADRAPSFSAKTNSGEIVQLDSLLKKGPVVLLFYRGAWCPYCNKQLSELQDSIALLTAKGATVVAITPEAIENIDKTIEDTKASFPIIHDKKYEIMKAYKTAFVVDDVTLNRYKKRNIDLTKANGNKDNVLPVPATYHYQRRCHKIRLF
ncbi:MAG TPA: peroxiredoxin-like family protein [Cytophagaceae bacterium]